MENDYYDVEADNERLWELYVLWCDDHHVKPRLKHYLQWVDERYDYEPDPIPEEVMREAALDSARRLLEQE